MVLLIRPSILLRHSGRGARGADPYRSGVLGEVARLQAEESMSPLAAIKAVYAELALGPAAARRALIPPGAVRSL